MAFLLCVLLSNDFDYLGHKTGACKDLLSTSYTVESYKEALKRVMQVK